MRALMGILLLPLLPAVAIAGLGPVTGPDTIEWKGLIWTVDANATAEVDGNGNLQISVGGDTGDPAADNWNVHADIGGLYSAADYERGVWFEFSFIDNGLLPDGNGNFAYGGGPRGYLDTWEENPNDGVMTEYMFQGGMYDGYADYYVNRSSYQSGNGWDPTDWFFPGGRSLGVHSFKALLKTGPTDADNTVDLYYDGVHMGTVSGRDAVPTYFQTAYLGVTSNGLTEGGPGYGVYTDFQHGVVPVPGAALLGFVGLACAGAVRRKLEA